MRSFEDLDARNGMNRAPRSSRDLTARSFENQLMGNRLVKLYYKDRNIYYQTLCFKKVNTKSHVILQCSVRF